MNKYTDSVYSCQPNLLDKTEELIKKITDVDKRIAFRKQLHTLKISPTVSEGSDIDAIADEVSEMFNSYTRSDFDIDASFATVWSLIEKTGRVSRGIDIRFPDEKITEKKYLNVDCNRSEKIISKLKKEFGIIDFLNLFDDDFCRLYFDYIRFGDGPVACPNCNNEYPYILKERDQPDRYKCRHCRKKFSWKSSSVFKNTNLSLRQWFLLIYFNSILKKNTSSIQNAKNMGIQQCTAWNMQSKIRSLMYQDGPKLSGIVEIDEAFCAKGNRWNRWGGFSTRKSPILGMVERNGRAILKRIPDRERQTILKMLDEYVETGSVIYTDGWRSYRNIPGYEHDFVSHASMEYVRGDVHTNTIENVWSHFKKNIRNAHHSISEKHLQSYMDEAAFKYNYRDMNQMERFDILLKRACNL